MEAIKMNETFSNSQTIRMTTGNILSDIPLPSNYKLKAPVLLEWEESPEGYVITCPIFDYDYGCGDTWDSALNDLGTSIIDSLYSLRRYRDKLESYLLGILETMEEMINE
jgi:hypothetical protein